MCFPKKKKNTPSADSLLVTSISKDSLKEPNPDEPKVIIVGAGAAGLACATKLLSYGFTNVTILEAEHRIGGRIHTKPFGSNFVDLGAQWVHGEKGNGVFEMVENIEVLASTGDIYVTFECIRSNGEKVPQDIVDRLETLVADIFLARYEELPDFQGSFGEYFEGKFIAALAEEEFSDIDETVASEFFRTIKKMEQEQTTLDIDEVSSIGFLNYWECGGDSMLNWKDKGFIQFLRILTEADLHKSEVGVLDRKIKYGMIVQEIDWFRDDAKVELKCKDYEEPFEADHVILTVSLGVLKAHHQSMFVPALPVEKVRAIEGLGFGVICKIFVEFPEKFWPNEWTGFSALWRKEDSEEIRETSMAWVEDFFGFYCVNYQPRLLLGWIVGHYVMHVETLPPEEVQEGVMYLLRRFYPSWDIPEPVNILVSRWGSNPNFLGCNSFRSMKTEEFNTGAHDLMTPLTKIAPAPLEEPESSPSAKSLSENSQTSQVSVHATKTPIAYNPKPILQFAGEATSDHHFSTVHGAVESGWREAHRLARYYGREK